MVRTAMFSFTMDAATIVTIRVAALQLGEEYGDMNRIATLALVFLLVPAAHAGVVHNEGVNGDLSTNPAAPTALVFAAGGNTVIGSVTSAAAASDPRDYITFTIPAAHKLAHLNLLSYSPPGLAFAAFNAGATSFIPDFTTDPFFLSGIHVGGADVGTDLMPLFVSSNVTSNALPEPLLDPGTYCFLIQQANTTLTNYQMEFVLESAVPTRSSSWGMIKSLYK